MEPETFANTCEIIKFAYLGLGAAYVVAEVCSIVSFVRALRKTDKTIAKYCEDTDRFIQSGDKFMKSLDAILKQPA